jgi:acetaldehyde dehydrogenase (acetylating)
LFFKKNTFNKNTRIIKIYIKKEKIKMAIKNNKKTPKKNNTKKVIVSPNKKKVVSSLNKKSNTPIAKKTIVTTSKKKIAKKSSNNTNNKFAKVAVYNPPYHVVNDPKDTVIHAIKSKNAKMKKTRLFLDVDGTLVAMQYNPHYLAKEVQ